MTEVILDLEAAIDDSIALLCAAAGDDVTLRAVTCVGAGFTVDQAVENTKSLLELVGRRDVPVFRGAERTFVNTAAKAAVHGPTGTGNATLEPSPYATSTEQAARALVRLARERPGEITLVTGGPLTNLALALDLDPDLPTLLRRWVMMGGAYRVAGNMTAAAEANIYADSGSAARCFDAFAKARQLPLAIGLDITTRLWFSPGDLDTALTIKEEENAQPETVDFLRDALEIYLDFHARRLDRAGCYLPDVCALAIALNPRHVVSVDAHIDVETSGAMEGRTFEVPLTNGNSANFAIAVGVDTAALHTDVLGRISDTHRLRPSAFAGDVIV